MTDANWDREADVIVIGAGATGMPAAIVAREAGCSVILVEAEADIGGHAITSGGNVPLGGGTSVQRAYGIEDSPDLVFRDLIDWSLTELNGAADYRWNDRLRFTGEAFDFGGRVDPKPHLRLFSEYVLRKEKPRTPQIFLSTGYDNPLNHSRSVTFGGGIRWRDDDLKYLIGSVPIGK